MQVFDFKANWHLVVPHLKDANLNEMLERCVNRYLQDDYDFRVAQTGGPVVWLGRYEPANGPWFYTRSDYWLTYATELADAAVDRGDFAWNCKDGEEPTEEEFDRYSEFCNQFYPRCGTYQWYQLFGACHWLAPWLKALGKRVFPHLKWRVMQSEWHSFAYGVDPDGNGIIFDILLFETHSAQQILDWAKGKDVDAGQERYSKEVA